ELAQRLHVSSLTGDPRERFDTDIADLRVGERFDADWFYAPFLLQATLLDHLPDDALVVVDEPADVAAVQRERDDQAKDARRDLEARGELPTGLPEPHMAWPELQALIEAREHRLQLSRWATGDAEAPDADAALRLPFGPTAAYGGRLRALADELTQMLRRRQQVVIVSTQSARLNELLEEHDVFAHVTEAMATPQIGRGGLTMIHGSLPHGWTVGEEGAGLTLLTDAEVFGFSKQRRAPPRKGASREAFLSELTAGEFVVHIEHGIAKFAGLVRKGIGGDEHE